MPPARTPQVIRGWAIGMEPENPWQDPFLDTFSEADIHTCEMLCKQVGAPQRDSRNASACCDVHLCAAVRVRRQHNAPEHSMTHDS